MRDLFSILSAVYRGYAGDGERHILRILLVVVISFFIAIAPGSLNKDAISTMAVIVSVLAGFSFTALFSNHSHSVTDLPPEKTESDREDIKKLKKLFENFRSRSTYFLIISLSCLILSFLVSISYNIESSTNDINPNNILYINDIFIFIWKLNSFFSRLTCLLLFFEIIYTFYRLSETIFSILDTRRQYLEAIR